MKIEICHLSNSEAIIQTALRNKPLLRCRDKTIKFHKSGGGEVFVEIITKDGVFIARVYNSGEVKFLPLCTRINGDRLSFRGNFNQYDRNQFYWERATDEEKEAFLTLHKTGICLKWKDGTPFSPPHPAVSLKEKLRLSQMVRNVKREALLSLLPNA